MKKILKLITVGLLIATGVGMLAPTSTTANVSQEPQQQNEQSAGHQESAAYEFIAPKDGSLTLLTRRAIQLYDEANDTIELSKAAVIYTETNVVRQMGGRQLETGEQVAIDKKLIEEFAEKSRDLSPAAIAAWQQYALAANFDLKDIEPIRHQATSSTSTEVKSEDQETDRSDADKPSPTDDQADKPAVTDDTKPETKSKPQTAQQWLIVLSGVAIVYFLYTDRRT